MRNKFLLKQSEATTTTTKKRAFTRSHTNNMVNMSERTNVTHKPCNACIKSRRNYFFIIMFEFDTRHIVCAVWCVFVVLKLVNALFLWKLVRALKLKELLFCVDKFKYKTNYRCTLNDDPSHGLASEQDKSRGRTKQKRKEKKVERKTENRLNGEWKYSRNIIIINSMVHTTLNPSSSEVLSFFKILSYCVQTFPIPSHTEQYTYIRVLQTERSLNGDWCGFSSIESERASAKEATKVAVAIPKFRMALYYFTLVRGNGVGELRVLFTVQYRRQLDNKIYVYTYTNVVFK